jgi:hypothetical protein
MGTRITLADEEPEEMAAPRTHRPADRRKA